MGLVLRSSGYIKGTGGLLNIVHLSSIGVNAEESVKNLEAYLMDAAIRSCKGNTNCVVQVNGNPFGRAFHLMKVSF